MVLSVIQGVSLHAVLERFPVVPVKGPVIPARFNHPLMQISGRRRATRRASPARSAASTTPSTSL